MAEIVTFAAPVDPIRTVFRIGLLSFDWFNATITVHLREWDGTKFTDRPPVVATYNGDVATTLMTQLNKINLSTQSLHQRVMTRLAADGKIPAGTASGAPD